MRGREVLANVFSGTFRCIFRWYDPLAVIGMENIPDKPCILYSNHTSHLDNAIILHCLNYEIMNTGFLAARDHFFDKDKTGYMFNYLFNLIAVNRDNNISAFKSTLRECREFMTQGGKYLVIYPEGTRSTTGELQAFKNGIFMLAKHLELPLVPLYISGAKDALPKASWFLRARKLTVNIGKPVDVNDLTIQSNQQSRRTVNEEMTMKLYDELVKLAKEQA